MTWKFAKEFQERFLIWIAEQDMTATATGLGTCWQIPFINLWCVSSRKMLGSGSNFNMHANLNVKIAVLMVVSETRWCYSSGT